MLGNRVNDVVVKIKIQFRCKANCPERSHRVFSYALCSVTDKSNFALRKVFHTTKVVDHAKVGDVVVEGVNREIAPDCIVCQCAAKYVVTHNATTVANLATITFGVCRPKRCNLDDVPAKDHMRQTKATPDKPAIVEQSFDFFRTGVSRDIEIFGPLAKQQVSHTTTNQVAGKARIVQTIQNF